MRVEITEKSLKDAGYDLTEGDTITVPAEIGAAWCKHGWAKDTEGKVLTGKRVMRGETIQVNSSAHDAVDSNPSEG